MSLKWIALTALAIALGAFAAGWYVRDEGARADLAAAKLDRAADQTGYALASAQAESAALEKYAADAQRFAEIDKVHQQEMEHAKATADQVIAGLRRGDIRLRDEWATARATAAATQAAPGAGVADEATTLREQGAADLVRAAVECDSTITGLQRVLTAEREDQSPRKGP